MNEIDFDWARMQVVKAMSRSVSQAQQYLEDLGGCRYRYFLSRVVQVWNQPASWLSQGTAVHAAAEWWERGGRKASVAEMQQVFKNEYRDSIENLLLDTPNPAYWSESGPYDGQADMTRRANLGMEQVKSYWDYYTNQKPGQVIWITPEGTPAIELEFFETFGSVQVRGILDQIIEETQPELSLIFIRDIKTGASPGGIFQLGTYRYAILKKYGVDTDDGDYWMARNKGPTKKYDLKAMSLEQVTDYYERTDQGIKAESFKPSPSPKKCERCPVRKACRFKI